MYGGCRLQRLLVGEGFTSVLVEVLGGKSVWRTPASSGKNPQAPDCFFTFCVREFSVKCEALSSNFWFLARIVIRASLYLVLPRYG
jgi:hypothetical protein